MPVFLVKIGNRYSNSPLSWVEVVDAMVMKRSSAHVLSRAGEDREGEGGGEEEPSRESHHVSSPLRKAAASGVAGPAKKGAAGPASMRRP